MCKVGDDLNRCVELFCKTGCRVRYGVVTRGTFGVKPTTAIPEPDAVACGIVEQFIRVNVYRFFVRIGLLLGFDLSQF